MSSLATFKLIMCVWCSRLVVWCLWSIQFEWDVLPTRPKLKSLQWNQVVLLERLGLLTEIHYNDDQTKRFLRFRLNCHYRIQNNVGSKFCLTNSNKRQNQKILKGAKALIENILHIFEKTYFVHVYVFNNLNQMGCCKESVKYGL